MKKLVLLGDSIRMIGYGTVIDKYLPDYEIWQPEDNCRFASYLLRLIFEFQDKIKGADVIHFNAGVWDTPVLFNDGIPFTPIDTYVETISRIADLLKKMGKVVIFSNTIPIRDGQPHNTRERIDQYNAAVKDMLISKGIIYNDINSIVAKDINKFIREDDCIHLTDEGKEIIAEEIAELIKKVAK